MITVLDRNAAHWQRTNLGTPSKAGLRPMHCQTQHQTTRPRVFEGKGWRRGPKPICSPAKQAAFTDPRSASLPGLWPLLSCPMQSHPRCCQARHPEPGSQARCGRTEHPNSTSLPSLCLFFSGPNQSHASRRNARPSRAHRHWTLPTSWRLLESEMTVATPMAPAYTVGSFLSEVHRAAVSATVLEEAEPPPRQRRSASAPAAP